MSKNSSLYEDVKWYLSYEILYFESDDPLKQQDYLVWENLVLIKADSPEEAYDKAVRHGLSSEEEVTINGQPGRCKFKGLKDLIKIYEEIEDGAEIEWREYEVSKNSLNTLTIDKKKMHAFKPLPPAEDYI
jgi:hypothetical protein